MPKLRDIAYTLSMSSIRAGVRAIEEGNIGQARVCARRGCRIAIDFWLQVNPDIDWGPSAITMLKNLQEDYNIPENVREAAYRLTNRVNQNFETGFEEDPLKDGETIIEYFLDLKILGE
ncbi:MAG: hypothetical protein RBR74_11040 [Ignavibacteriaceae bacterium]|jgi:hypothetical protein|nr:hypothetical protein [Ignavibacteriaceae bacterium]